ncbi:MAG: hypothetical protein ACI39U_00400 [Candidatus Cryptobacteroides sp.]
MEKTVLNFSNGDYLSPQICTFCLDVEAGVTESGNAKFEDGVGIKAYELDSDL